MNRKLLALGALAALFPVTSVAAKPQKQQARPELFEAVVRCRGVSESAARLKCFDDTTAMLQQAADRRDLVVVDKTQVREARKSLFGLTMPDLGLFGGNDEGEEELKQIEGVLTNVGSNRDGYYTFLLADGARWSQIDGKPIAVAPKAGHKVVVKRGSLGSYMMSVAGQPGVKVQRVN
ncbi:hypothetical protein [Allosphingosinicella deserti]|uniref:hypothetical protein n=1 Tax=Allosphingosinicella deserti TaxID=2116704 RepID=UPI0011B2612F|nr:hypothetical protein [Sphingomonas deserti]